MAETTSESFPKRVSFADNGKSSEAHFPAPAATTTRGEANEVTDMFKNLSKKKKSKKHEKKVAKIAEPAESGPDEAAKFDKVEELTARGNTGNDKLAESASADLPATTPQEEVDEKTTKGLVEKKNTKKSDKKGAKNAELAEAEAEARLDDAAKVENVEESAARETTDNDDLAKPESVDLPTLVMNSQQSVDEMTETFKDLPKKKKAKKSDKKVTKVTEPREAAGPDEAAKMEESTASGIADEKLAESASVDLPTLVTTSQQSVDEVTEMFKDLPKKKKTKKFDKKAAKITEPTEEAGPDEAAKMEESTASGTADNEKPAESASVDLHALATTSQQSMDEVTDMFKDLPKKKKTKKSDKKAAKITETMEEAGPYKAIKTQKVEELIGGVENSAGSGSASPPAPGTTAQESVDELTEMFKNLAKKKKTKKSGKKLATTGSAEGPEPVSENATEVEDPTGGDAEKGTGIWNHNATADMKYDQLLERFFQILSVQNPDMMSGMTKSYKIPPPQCLREGNKKTVFANISEICGRMKRSEEHATSYLFAELGTNGSVDSSRRLIIKGRFQQKQIENVLRRYIMEYVTCKTCHSQRTELSKGENRLSFITCNSCGSRRSVTAIKTGFSAQIGKRRKQKA